MGPMSEEETQRMMLREIYRNAFASLRTFWENRIHIESRGWSQQLCYNMGVATVTSWEEFTARLRSMRGYTKADLERAGIKPKLFHPEAITFTLFDEHGDPVGFAVRDMRYGKVDGVKKYINSAIKKGNKKCQKELFWFYLLSASS